jgi:hypothetical protein
MVHSTVSELSRKGGAAEKRHESAKAGAARNNIVAEEMMPIHIVRSPKLPTHLKKLFVHE